MKVFIEKPKKRFCIHKYDRAKENYIYTSPVIIPRLDFDESTGMLHIEEIEDHPVKAGAETIYRCRKCGELKIIYYRGFKED